MASDATAPIEASSAPKVALLNRPEVRSFVFQALLTIAIIYVVYSGIANMFAALERAGISSGFGFLDSTAGFSISQSLIEYSPSSSTYLDVFVVGLLNTLIVAAFGVVLATVLGFTVGVARLSNNWIIGRLAKIYVETFRNIPLLLHIFIWYFGVLRLLPQPRESADFGFMGMLNNRGYFAPKPIWGEGGMAIFIALLVGIVIAFLVANWAKKRQMATGQPFPRFWAGLGIIIAVPLVVFFAVGSPLTWDLPVMGGFKPKGGMTLIPEFMALLLALTTYTAAFIAEIVRAGILAVNKGQTEAAHALGLRNGTTLNLVVIPQAMRIIIPPLTSQYLNLTKNSSLAVAIAYPDLTSVFAGTALNQQGQAVEFITITMLTYLTISIVTSMFMNWYNARVALIER